MIGKQLRNLKTHHTQSTVQYLINNIMYEAKLGKYDNPSSNIPLYLHHSSNQIEEINIPNIHQNEIEPNNIQENEYEYKINSISGPSYLHI